MKRWNLRKSLRTAVVSVLLAGAFAGTAFALDDDIVVLYTNDVHCGVEDNMGYSGLSLYRKQMEAETPYVFLVDAGDAIQGAPIGTLSDGGYPVDIMNKAGYDFAVPGNHEFDYGMDRFLELSGKLNCGYYSCNFMDLKTGEPKFAPYKMETFDDVQVAFVGVCTPESYTKSTPAYFQDESGAYIYGFCEDETGDSLYRQIQKSVDSARAEGADYVILAGHLGKDGITEKWSVRQVAANTSGIDAIIDGHSHQNYQETMVNKDGKEIPVSQTGTKLENIGKLTITTDGALKMELISQVPASGIRTVTVQKGDTLSRIAKRTLGSANAWPEIYNLNKDVVRDPNTLSVGTVLKISGSSAAAEGEKNTDPEMDVFIAGIKAQYEESLKTVLGRADVELTDKNPATGERAVRRAETNLGDLCADAFRYELGADVGLMNGGGIRAGIQAGNITYEDALKVYPYGNMACSVRVTGQQLKDALEMASKNYPEESGGFLHVSGITYTVDSSVASSVQTDDKRNFTGVSGEYRVKDIMVGGEPLDLSKTYTVASHNYMLKNGGDGMTMFVGSEVVKDDVMVDVDTLTSYIGKYLGGTVGEGYEKPEGQGRITIR